MRRWCRVAAVAADLFRSTPMTVDRCVCRNITFAQLIALHERTGRGFDDLAKETLLGDGCGICVPYAKAAVVTGKAKLPACGPGQLALIVKRAQAARERAGPATSQGAGQASGSRAEG
jgi:bacterioferritin-associated ferredoxin